MEKRHFFTTAVAGIIGFRWTNGGLKGHDCALGILIALLTVAHGYFNIYAHWRLAEKRTERAFLRERMGESIALKDKKIWGNFIKGLGDHLLVFFLINVLILGCGLFFVLADPLSVRSDYNFIGFGSPIFCMYMCMSENSS